jgi:hypothetical protein
MLLFFALAFTVAVTFTFAFTFTFALTFAFAVLAGLGLLGKKAGCRERQYCECATADQTLQERAPFGLYLIQDGIDSVFVL